MGRVLSHLRAATGVALAVLIVTAGCSGPEQEPAGSRPTTATSQAAATAPAYEGPDEYHVRTQFMALMEAEQRAAETALGGVTWLEEPAFAYRQSMNGSVVASLYVIGTTKAAPARADAWVRQANEPLVSNGFEPVAGLTQDAGGGLLITSPNVDADACFSARWGQGSLSLTIEVAATDVVCG